jgi:hypothetical protein
MILIRYNVKPAPKKRKVALKKINYNQGKILPLNIDKMPKKYLPLKFTIKML